MDLSSAVRQVAYIYRSIISLVRPKSAYPALTRIVRTYHSRSKPPQVLYLGDSVVERVSREDSDQRTLGQMLIDALAPRCSGLYISGSGYQSEVFYYLLRTIERMRHKPEVVILPVNMRSFSPQWHLHPKWQFEQEISILKNYLHNPASLSRGFVEENSSDQIFVSRVVDFANTPVDYPLTNFNRIGDFVKIIETASSDEMEANFRKKQIFIFHYLYSLQRDHPKVMLWENMLNYLIGMEIRAFIYVTPINFQAGERFVGPVFRQYLDANLQVIVDLLQPFTLSGKVMFENWCTWFDLNRFFQKDLATEHLNQSGRLELASLIRNVLFEKWK